MPEELLVPAVPSAAASPSSAALPFAAPPLSQLARTVDTFVAPSKTFTDILRSAACWLPLLLLCLLSVGYNYAVDRTIGFPAVYEQQLAKSPKQQQKIQEMPADQRARIAEVSARITRISGYGAIVFVVLVLLVQSLLLWASFNFGLGAGTRYAQVFAVCTFASLPAQGIKLLLAAVLIFAGVGTESFDIRNPLGTNLGYYLGDAAPWMRTAGTFFDILGFWSLALLVLGMALISGKKIAQSAAVVFGWWLLTLVLFTGFAAAFS